MSLYNTTKIKELPQLEEIVDGNYIIVENEQGTYILDFVDFIIGPNNVSFYNVITNLSAKQISLSASVDTGFFNLSTNVVSAVNTIVSNLTANYPRYFEVYPDPITIETGKFFGTSIFNSELSNILINDVNIVPTNSEAGKLNCCMILTSETHPGVPPTPTVYTYTLTVSSETAATQNATFVSKVLKYF